LQFRLRLTPCNLSCVQFANRSEVDARRREMPVWRIECGARVRKRAADRHELGVGRATFSTTRGFTVDSSLPVSFGQYPASQQTTGIPPTIDGRRVPGGEPSFR